MLVKSGLSVSLADKNG